MAHRFDLGAVYLNWHVFGGDLWLVDVRRQIGRSPDPWARVRRFPLCAADHPIGAIL